MLRVLHVQDGEHVYLQQAGNPNVTNALACCRLQQCVRLVQTTPLAIFTAERRHGFKMLHQLADNLTKGNFTRDEWNHLLNLFNISHFSSTACTATMAKRAQQGSGEERVTAKSRPMMNLTARMLSVVSSSTSSNPGRTSCGYQDPGKSVASDDRSGKLVKPSPPGYSKEDYGRSWSSQEWKSGAAKHDRPGKPEEISWDTLQKVDPHREEPLLGRNAHSARYGELIHDRTGKPVSLNQQEQAYSENFVMGSDAAELVDKVKDQVRNRQKKCRTLQSQVKSIQQYGECSWLRR